MGMPYFEGEIFTQEGLRTCSFYRHRSAAAVSQAFHRLWSILLAHWINLVAKHM